MARKLADEARLRAKGVSDPKVEQYAAAEARPLKEHLGDFTKWLSGQQRTAGHVETIEARASRLLDRCGAKHIHELTISRVGKALELLRSEGLALQTLTHYVRAIEQFAAWLVRDGRARENALAHLEGFDAAKDRKRVRRVLPPGDLRRLIEAARNGPPIGGVSGPDRAVFCQTALCSGLRRSELASLTPESFDLDATPPTITVQARDARNRKPTVQPIPLALADLLRPWLQGRPAGERVFRLPYWTAKMLREDLDACNPPIPYRTAEGYFDLHAARAVYISMLAMSNIPLAIVQRLARHSDPRLTLNVYAHIDQQQKGEAVASMPVAGTLPMPEERTAPATADERLEPSRCGNDHQCDELDSEDTEAVSYKALGSDLQGSALPVGRDGVWWPHWSSKPVAGR